jgi:hypothetical protein
MLQRYGASAADACAREAHWRLSQPSGYSFTIILALLSGGQR